MVPYSVEEIDLTTAKVMAPIVPEGESVAMVTVRECPVGTVLSLAIGRNPAIPNVIERDGWEVCPPDNGGIYITAPAQPGIVVKLLVSYA